MIKTFSNTPLSPFGLDDNFVYLVQVKFQLHCELFRKMRHIYLLSVQHGAYKLPVILI